jgi:hypothetical protein
MYLEKVSENGNKEKDYEKDNKSKAKDQSSVPDPHCVTEREIPDRRCS